MQLGNGRQSDFKRKFLPLVGEGKTNKENANALGLSDNTLKNYLSNIFSKLNLSRRAEAAAGSVLL